MHPTLKANKVKQVIYRWNRHSQCRIWQLLKRKYVDQYKCSSISNSSRTSSDTWWSRTESGNPPSMRSHQAKLSLARPRGSRWSLRCRIASLEWQQQLCPIVQNSPNKTWCWVVQLPCHSLVCRLAPPASTFRWWRWMSSESMRGRKRQRIRRRHRKSLKLMKNLVSSSQPQCKRNHSLRRNNRFQICNKTKMAMIK